MPIALADLPPDTLPSETGLFRGAHVPMLDALAKSDAAVHAVLKELKHESARFDTAYVVPIQMAENEAECATVRDKGDIEWWEKGRRLTIEVKHYPTKHWTLDTGWPLREVWLSTCAAYDRNRASIIAFIIVCDDLSHYAVVRASTWRTWRRELRWCPNAGRMELKYIARPGQARIMQMRTRPPIPANGSIGGRYVTIPQLCLPGVFSDSSDAPGLEDNVPIFGPDLPFEFGGPLFS